jgi:hypothetical protein
MKIKAMHECDYAITGERFKLTLIEIEEEKLKIMLSNKGNAMTIEQSLIHLSKWVGSWVNKKDITVREYFNLVAEFEKYNRELNGKTDKVK